MARNIEIKARIDSIGAMLPTVAALATQGPTEIIQDDTFFQCRNGRLKLRVLSQDEAQLIFYRRADESGPKESYFLISPVPAPDSMRDILDSAYGSIGRVRKNRTLYLVGRTRIHLDRVEGLGQFIELEVMLDDGEDAEQGIAEAHRLMAQLAIDPSMLIEGAYIDLLRNNVGQMIFSR
jgi:predicted adenylyl cyclase CyaB